MRNQFHFSASMANARTAIVAVVLASVLGGCAQLPWMDEAATAKPIEQYQTQQSLSGKSADWPQDAWWQAYDDAQLDALIKEGLQGSPTMAIAEARLRRARAMTQVTGSASKPQLNAGAKASMEKQSYNYLYPRSALPDGWNDYGQAGLDFSWEIDFWGKHKAALAAATSMQEATAAEVAQARLALAASIATAYGEFARLYVQHDTAEAVVAVRTKTLELLKKRRTHGLEILANVKQAEARKALAEEDLLALGEQLALQRNRLAALLGAGPDRGLSIKRPTINVAKSFGLPQQMHLALLGRRPDIVAARLRVEAYEQTVEKQKAEFYPNVNLSAMIGFQSLGLNMLAKKDAYMGSVGPAISLPIFNGGRLRGQLRSARADYDEAIGTYNQTVTQALQEVADASVSQKYLSRQVDKLQQAMQAASEAHRLMKDRYEGGLSNYLDVLSAEETLLSTQRTLRDMQSRAFTLDVALIKSLGGGYRGDAE